MSFFRKLIGKNDKSEVAHKHTTEQAVGDVEPSPSDAVPNPQAQSIPPQSEQPKVFIPGQPHTNVSAIQNAGMLGGVVLGGESGAGAGAGAVDGMVVGNIVGQGINRARKQEYWREQALNYQEGLPAAGVGDPNVVSPQGPRDRSSRDERRKKRWSRRAERRAA